MRMVLRGILDVCASTSGRTRGRWFHFDTPTRSTVCQQTWLAGEYILDFSRIFPRMPCRLNLHVYYIRIRVYLNRVRNRRPRTCVESTLVLLKSIINSNSLRGNINTEKSCDQKMLDGTCRLIDFAIAKPIARSCSCAYCVPSSFMFYHFLPGREREAFSQNK
jgi:hypothetical protein